MVQRGVLLSILGAAFALSCHRVYTGFIDMIAINNAQERVIQDVQIWANKLNANGYDPSYLLPVDQPDYGLVLFSILSGGVLAVLCYIQWCAIFVRFRAQAEGYEKLLDNCMALHSTDSPRTEKHQP